jgi:hypothetical protein
MQFPRTLGGLVLLCAIAGQSPAQGLPYSATVSVSEAEVRCKPSKADLSYPTNLLHKGDRVRVLKEEAGGWLAIEPPAGSFSWINKRFLQPLGKDTWLVSVVDDAMVDVLYGSQIRKEKPSVRSVTLKRGALVHSIGQALASDDGMWLPIQPPPGEMRYIQAEAVRRDDLAAASSSGNTLTGASPASQQWNQGGSVAVPPVSYSGEPPSASGAARPGQERWLAAQRAEREGRIQEAIELYTRLGQDSANTDHSLSTDCFNRAAYLRQQAASMVARTYAARPTTTDNRLRPVAAGAGAYAAAGYAPQNCCIPCKNEAWVRIGKLRHSGRSLNYKPTYVLETSQGQLITYVTAQPGVNLEEEVDHFVELGGSMYWWGEIRNNYMVASRVTRIK